MGDARAHQAGTISFAVALLAGLALVLAGCNISAGGAGGIPLTGLGSGPDAAQGTPTISGGDPGGQYAFVFGDQVWIKRSGQSAPTQLTHLPLSSGAQLEWGPLMWSPDRGHIAFVLVQDATGGGHERSAGPIYVVNTSSGDTQITAGTGSIHSHTYAWYGNEALFYANGGGISFYDLSDPADPRAYPAVPLSMSGGTTVYVTYGDIQFSGQDLYATRIEVNRVGGTGIVGHAYIYHYSVGQGPNDYSGGPLNIYNSYEVANLGDAYSDSHGAVEAGGWQMAPDPNGGIVYQQITGVDPQARTVSSSICYNYPGDYMGGCDQQLFQPVSKQPLNALPQFGFSSDSKLIAMTGSAVSIQSHDGGQVAQYQPGAWGTPPQWSSNNKEAIATQLVSATADAAGMVHYVTNVVAYPVGGKPSVLISGAQDFG